MMDLGRHWPSKVVWTRPHRPKTQEVDIHGSEAYLGSVWIGRGGVDGRRWERFHGGGGPGSASGSGGGKEGSHGRGLAAGGGGETRERVGLGMEAIEVFWLGVTEYI